METNAMKLMNELNETGTVFVKEFEIARALDLYLEAIKADYRKWNGSDPTDVQVKMSAEFDAGLHIVETPLYYRVMTKTSCHSFIVKADGPKFKRGDILKSAGYNTPAKNQARGNLFTGYRIRWTGAEYLR